MAQCPVTCSLLDSNDPEVTLVELNHKIMELIGSDDDTTAVEAASYSLGLCTDADTHLARLEEFGVKHFLDQRRAHRCSDRGLHQLVRLISTHWATQAAPKATPILVGLDETQVGFTAQLRCQRRIHIHSPQLSLWQGNGSQATSLAPAWTTTSRPGTLWRERELTISTIVRPQDETATGLVWGGEA